MRHSFLRIACMAALAMSSTSVQSLDVKPPLPDWREPKWRDRSRGGQWPKPQRRNPTKQARKRNRYQKRK